MESEDASVFDAVTVTCCERLWHLRDAPAHDWIMGIGADPATLAHIFPGMLRDADIPAMYTLSRTVPDIERRWLNVARKAVSKASGRPDWWWATNLTTRVLSGWQYVNGTLLRQGVDARRLSFPDWLDAAFSLLWERSDEGGRTKLEMELNFPPASLNLQVRSEVAKQTLNAFAAD